MIVTKAPSKIILFGEHAVVYDKLGIVATTDKSTHMKVEEYGDGLTSAYGTEVFSRTKEDVSEFYERFSKFYEEKNFDEIKKMSFNDALSVVYSKLIEKFGYKGVMITTVHDRSLKGMGGSASTFAAFVLGYAKLLGKQISTKEIADISFIGDVVAHAGIPSGIDTSAVTYGGYLTYRKSEGMKKIDIDFEIPILIVDSGEPAKTSETVSYVRKLRGDDVKFVDAVFEKLDNISRDALSALKSKDIAEFGRLMYEYYSELKKLNISTDRLDAIIAIARSSGALGAKPTGGWGGGNCIVLAKDAEHINELIKIYNENGYSAFSTELGVEGVHLE